DLGTTRYTEAEPAEKVDQLVGGLGEGMTMAQAGDDSRKRDINRAGGHGAAADRNSFNLSTCRYMPSPGGHIAGFQPQSGGVEGGLEGLLDAVELLAIGTLAGRIQRSQPLLGCFELTLLLAQIFDPRNLERRGACGRNQRCNTELLEAFQLTQRDFQGIGRAHRGVRGQ